MLGVGDDSSYDIRDSAGGGREMAGGAQGSHISLPLTEMMSHKHFLEDESNMLTDLWEKGP